MAWVKLYDKAAAPVPADTPKIVFGIPAGQTVVLPCGPLGLRFSAGLGHIITGAAAYADTTAVAVNQVSLNISYTA